MAAARGMPIPPADQIPPALECKPLLKEMEGSDAADKAVQALTMPIASRISSFSDGPQNAHIPAPAHSLPSSPSPIASGTSSSPLFRGRAKTLAALATSSKGNTQSDMMPREIMLSHDPLVNGQPIEAYLYKDASECPICFLYYPPYLNKTRCCDQPICSECFVQIKRPEPHPPEHSESDPNALSGGGERSNDGEWQLVSEPSACPFCVQPEFGVTYSPPPFRRGITYATSNTLHPGMAASPRSSTSSLSSGNLASYTGRRRATSLSANDPCVITTDKIRPDWAQKLANARAHAARRSAAASALHAAAYLMTSSGNVSDSRTFIGRRGVLRRPGGSGSQSPGGRTASPALHALAILSDRRAAAEQDNDPTEDASGTLAPPRSSSRRSRFEDLEDMMMMEAIRLSLASEEERCRKEEKEARKESKRKEKEAKKAERAARKNGIYSQNSSTAVLGGPSSGLLGRIESSSSSIFGEDSHSIGKGKGVDRASHAATLPVLTMPADQDAPYLSPLANRSDQDQSFPIFQPSPTEPSRPSHLRHMSSASSSSSSFMESTSGERLDSGTPPTGTSSIEPMFNFRSLAAVIGDEEKNGASSEHFEGTVHGPEVENSAILAESKSPLSFSSNPYEIKPVRSKSSSDILGPKELEMKSVEITGPTRDAETVT